MWHAPRVRVVSDVTPFPQEGGASPPPPHADVAASTPRLRSLEARLALRRVYRRLGSAAALLRAPLAPPPPPDAPDDGDDRLAAAAARIERSQQAAAALTASLDRLLASSALSLLFGDDAADAEAALRCRVDAAFDALTRRGAAQLAQVPEGVSPSALGAALARRRARAAAAPGSSLLTGGGGGSGGGGGDGGLLRGVERNGGGAAVRDAVRDDIAREAAALRDTPPLEALSAAAAFSRDVWSRLNGRRPAPSTPPPPPPDSSALQSPPLNGDAATAATATGSNATSASASAASCPSPLPPLPVPPPSRDAHLARLASLLADADVADAEFSSAAGAREAALRRRDDAGALRVPVGRTLRELDGAVRDARARLAVRRVQVEAERVAAALEAEAQAEAEAVAAAAAAADAPPSPPPPPPPPRRGFFASLLPPPAPLEAVTAAALANGSLPPHSTTASSPPPLLLQPSSSSSSAASSAAAVSAALSRDDASLALMVAEFGALDGALQRAAALVALGQVAAIDEEELDGLVRDAADLRARLGLPEAPPAADLPQGARGSSSGGASGLASSPNGENLFSRLMALIKDAIAASKEAFGFLSRGVRLLGEDVRGSSALVARAAWGGATLAPREVATLRRTSRDVAAFVPFVALLVAPITPIGHVMAFSFLQRYFPGLFPSQFTQRRQELFRRAEELRAALEAAQEEDSVCRPSNPVLISNPCTHPLYPQWLRLRARRCSAPQRRWPPSPSAASRHPTTGHRPTAAPATAAARRATDRRQRRWRRLRRRWGAATRGRRPPCGRSWSRRGRWTSCARRTDAHAFV